MNSFAPRGMDSRAWNGVPIGRRADGFVNATAICKATGKRWALYAENQRTHEYIRALLAHLGIQIDCGAAKVGIPTSGKRPVTGISVTGVEAVMHVVRGGHPQAQGTWIHPRLALDLARWVSPEFAVWMDGWFLEVMQQQFSTAPTPRPALPPTLPASQMAPAGGQEPLAGERCKLLPIVDDAGIEALAEQFVAFVQEDASRWRRRQERSRTEDAYDQFPIPGIRRYDHADPFVVAPIARHFLRWLRSPSAPGTMVESRTALVPCLPAFNGLLTGGLQ